MLSKRIGLISIFFLLTVGIWLASCGGSTIGPGDSSVTCTEDGDCPVGQACVEGVCQTPGGDNDIFCVGDSDCPSGWICLSNHCVEQSDGGTDGGDTSDAPDIEILAPLLSGDPPAYVLNFGSVMVGQTTSQGVRLRNDGSADLRIVDLVRELGTVDDFFVDQDILDSLPIVVAPGEETGFDVLYRASDGLSDLGVLSIISNDPDEARIPIQLVSEFKGTAKISVDPATLSFGDVVLGDTGSLTLSISNQGSGNAVIVLQGIQLASMVNDNYELDNLPEFPFYLNRGDVLDISVKFHPAAVGDAIDRVVIVSSDENNPQIEVSVDGRGVEPNLTVDPSPVDMGETPVSIAISTEVGLRDDGGAPLSITGISLQAGSTEFVLTSDPVNGFDLANLDASHPQLLMPGEERKIAIEYTPQDDGLDLTTLLIDSPDINPTPRQVVVRATGFIPPEIEFQPATLDFGQLHVNGMLSLPLVVSNAGQRFLTINNIQISGINSFSFLPAGVPNLGAGEQASLQVTFAPLSTGSHQADLVFTSNDPANPVVSVPMSGQSIDPDIFVWPPAPIDFGQVYRGTVNQKTIEIYAAGMGPLEVTNIELIPSVSDFDLVNLPQLPATVQNSGQPLSFVLQYAPPAEGADSVALKIDSSDLDNPSLMLTVLGNAIGCPNGFWDIDGDPANGCEYACVQTNGAVEACDYIDNDCDSEVDEDFNLDSDPDNCGLCNVGCVYNHATGLCNGGSCALGACDSGHWDINADPTDGCEYTCTTSNSGVEACDHIDNDCDSFTDEDFTLDSDVSNCGACGNVCDLYSAVPACSNYNCVVSSCLTGFENCDLVDFNGCEIDTMNDPDNCNGCDIICHFNNAPALCVDGSCVQGDCSGNFVDCDLNPDNGCEVNTNTDELNCGGCGNTCDQDEVCVSGECRCGGVGPNCTASETCCGIDCVDTQTDDDNCGGCNTICQQGEQCVNGSCSCSGTGPDCTQDEICCTGACFDPLSSALHCGDCDNSCDVNELCNMGNCNCGGVGPDCSLPLSCCGSSCVDLQGDEQNCGICDNICNLAHAVNQCQSGSCVILSCESGYANCNTSTPDGCEINISGDVANCGTCGNLCSNAHGGTQCLFGNCVPTCAGLWGDCDSDTDNGCETALNTLTDCGSCANPCDLPNASESCSGGSCVVTGCDSGYTDCNSQPGCETYTAGDVDNCGSCSNHCTNAHGSTQCSSGVCVPTCAGLWGNCDSDPDDGCETPLNTLANCGTCGSTCSLPNASQTCDTGSCQISSCNTGFSDCNTDDSDGCEIHTDADVDNCGSCGNGCTNAHGTTQCVAGSCDPSCQGLWGNCDFDPDDGCETALNTLTNCGTCGQACDLENASQSCSSGSCSITSCDSGYTDCNAQNADGCEVHTSADVDNCGSCGNTCTNAHGTTQCNTGICSPSCESLWGDCDSDPDNGCERPLDTLADCGGCGLACSLQNASESCSTGSCVISSCISGYTDCNSVTGDGCEVHTSVDTSNCGTCGNVCSNAHGTTQCSAGSCAPVCAGLWGDCDSDPDNGCETQLDTLTNCGSCGQTCNLLNATESCSTGSCVITSCNSGYTDCNSTDADGCEVHTAVDTANCGTCGNICSNGHGTTLCSGGTCSPTCSGLWGDCDSDPDNGCEEPLNTLMDCGDCGVVCDLPGSGETCVTGSCEISGCDTGYSDCTSAPGCETHTDVDVANCGTCGNACTNAHGTTQCISGNCDPACVGLWGDCDSDPDNGCETPVNTLTDCGSCDSGCDLLNAGESCSTGSCLITSCNSGFADCNSIDADGCEINTGNDVNNCGSCGHVCSNAHGTTQCVDGACVPSCGGLWGDCDGNPDNGCERPLNTLSDCGSCNSGCSLPHASETCASGSCLIASCDSGYSDCTAAAGCETNTAADVNNCGSCGNTCSNAHGSTQCSSGSCNPTCVGLWGNCDSDPDDGCETALNTLSNCGLCDQGCSLAHASESCSTGSCLITSCDSGYDDCDATASTGCEVHTDTDTSNCGSCGNVCSNAHGTTQCLSGGCFPSCAPLWASCDFDPDNGCETPINTLSDCGSCGQGCDLLHAAESCVTGSCLISSCNSGYNNCNGLDIDGCEINTASDVSNCGACSNQCTNSHGTTQCTSGNCDPSCSSLWGNCDSDPDDGCETPTNTLSDCGNCNVACDLPHAQESCTTGTCLITSCDSGWDDCDTGAGCETYISGDLNNCGGCGSVCNLAHASENCTSGSCLITSCDTDWWNVNSLNGDGCECGDTSDSVETCAAVVSSVGTISPSNTLISLNRVIVHRTSYRDDYDCYKVTYSRGSPGSGTFRIQLNPDPGNLAFKVWRNNCSAQVCGGDVSFVSNCSSTGVNCQTGNTNDFLVCVYAATSNSICQAYTLQFQYIP